MADPIDPRSLEIIEALRVAVEASRTGMTDLSRSLTVSLDTLERSVEKLKEQAELARRLSEITNDTTSYEEARRKVLIQEKELEAARILNGRTIAELSADDLENLVKISDELKKINVELKDIASAKSAGAKLASILGIDENNKNSLTYRIFSNPKDVFQGFKEQIANAGGVAAAFGALAVVKIADATKQAFFSYDNAAASISRLAGDSAKLQSVLSSTARGATAYGISFEQAGKAIEGLYTELNTFSNLNTKVQAELTISVAKLDKLGISSQQSAKQIATLTQIMGMSESQAAKTSEQLAGFALAIGKSPTQVASDFAGASDRLGAYGNKMLDVFKNLEAQSKGTGVALNDLLSITEKFQTFEGAATAAGKLNAALGGGFVNAMELLEASSEDPAKAIDLLRDRLNDAGLAFDKLSFYEKKLIADAGGFKTVEEASRILSMTNEQAERAAQADAERANQQQLVNEAIQRSIPIQQKIDMLMSNLAITMGPVVEALSGIVTFFTMIVDNPIGNVLVKIGIAAALLATPVGWVGAAVYALGAAFNYLHDILLVPRSPILFDVLSSMPNTFASISKSTEMLGSNLSNTVTNFQDFEKSAKGVASSLSSLPESISFTTPELNKLNTSMEVTNKITGATKLSVDSINNLNTDKAKMLVNVMSPQAPNVTVTPTINQPAPEVKVYLGNEPVKNIVNKVMNGGSNLAPQTLGVPIR